MQRRLRTIRIVVADSRSPRDGRCIEEIGAYNPLTEPATITVDSEKAKTWIQNGAQPTDTVRGPVEEGRCAVRWPKERWL